MYSSDRSISIDETDFGLTSIGENRMQSFIPTPLHPAIVHLPIALSVLLAAASSSSEVEKRGRSRFITVVEMPTTVARGSMRSTCLLYTSDAADE